MTVRWKPLLILSGLFLVTAVAGLVAIAFALVPRDSAELLRLAQEERAAKQFERAVIQYRRALQQDPRDARVHEEMAGLYAEWAEQAPAPKRAELKALRLRSLVEAAKSDQKAVAPRRQLLAEALRHDDASDASYWAQKLEALDPADADVNFVLAEDALDASPPDVSKAQGYLARLDREKPLRPRAEWIRARMAQQTRDRVRLAEILAAARTLAPPPQADVVDRLALLRLRVLDVETASDPSAVESRVAAIRDDARALTVQEEVSAARIARISGLLRRVEKALTQLAAGSDAATRARLTPLGESVEAVIEAAFQKAMAVKTPDLQICQAYAEHLAIRGRRDQCLRVVAEALKQPAAALAALAPSAMQLREVAVKAALADPKDDGRFAKAEPFIQGLIDAAAPQHQGLGHLFQGAIDLERSGLDAATRPEGGEDPARAEQDHLAGAVKHLKVAVTQLPAVPTARALLGVALLLSQEPGLGRQYLQEALRQGHLEPRYQIWAAWSMIQAGYPEDAEPIVSRLQEQVAAGQVPRELQGTLLLLRGEIAQARRTPADLRRAKAEYLKAFPGGEIPATVQLRLAQIDVLLGEAPAAVTRLQALRTSGKGGPAAEHLAVLTLLNLKKETEARALLDRARENFPDSGELAEIDAALHVKAGRPEAADTLLAAFLARNPKHVGAAQMRAQVLAERLDRVDEARKLLSNASEGSDNSGPLIQLALMDLARRDYDAAAQTIAKVRGRWKDAAAADLLDAQLGLAREDLAAAAGHLEAALKKDPNNKVARFWKAQLDDRAGAAAEAARVYEEIARDRPVKEIEEGLSLTAAAQWALAASALENRDLDGAIGRFEDLLKGGTAGELARPIRWKLVAAYSAKGQWPEARKEIVALLGDPQASPDERVQGANYLRQHQETAAALTQLDLALKAKPTHSGAVVSRAFLLAEAKKPAEAAGLLRAAIAAAPQPPAVYLMLAAIENAGAPAAAEARTAALAVLDQGLKAHPSSLDLVRAKYGLLRSTAGPSAARTFLQEKAKDDPQGLFRRLLAETYRQEQEFAQAEAVVRELLKQEPKEARLADQLIRLVAAQAVEAANRNDRRREQELNARTAALIRQYKAQFPNDLAFLQEECELAARLGDYTKAEGIAREMEKKDKNSTAGPLLRAQLYAAQGWTERAAQAYAEGLGLNPRRADIRLLLGQALLDLGRPEEALQQADRLLEGNPGASAPLLMKAKALAALGGRADQRAARRDQAIELLRGSIRERPQFAEAYHLIAALQVGQGRRTEAVATLKAGLKAVPGDANGLSLLVRTLTEPREQGKPPSPAEVGEAKALAESSGGPDSKGDLCLALAVGFHQAGQLELALPWAEKAARLLDAPVVHLDFGDLLLSMAEATTEPSSARALFQRAVAQYDLVLKAQANSVEAINNKAWILHRHLANDPAALELVQGLLRRAERKTLPGEFFDTLGSIQESMGKKKEAEDSFAEGLRKVPDHPVLNYHMGRLLAADRGRVGQAGDYLLKAQAAGDRLSREMATDVGRLLQTVGR